MGLDLNEEATADNHVDDQPTSIVQLPQACEYAQFLSSFVVQLLSEFSIIDVMNMQSFMGRLNKMLIFHIN